MRKGFAFSLFRPLLSSRNWLAVKGERLRAKLASVAILVVAIMALMGPAFAAGSGEAPPKVEDEVSQQDPSHDPEERPSTLPLTGGDILAFVVAGSAAAAAGGVLVRRTRTRAA
jgi:LPXTG-motif cell wall-anchored protein